MLNLFIAIIVNAMQSVHDSKRSEVTAAAETARAHVEAEMQGEFRALRQEMREPRQTLAERQAR